MKTNLETAGKLIPVVTSKSYESVSSQISVGSCIAAVMALDVVYSVEAQSATSTVYSVSNVLPAWRFNSVGAELDQNDLDPVQAPSITIDYDSESSNK